MKVKQKLRLQTVENGCAMEAEARAIFTESFTSKKSTSVGLASMIQEIVQTHTPDNKVLPLPDRKAKVSQRIIDFSNKA